MEEHCNIMVNTEVWCGQDIPVGTWQLMHTSGDQETTFKFHRSLIVKAGKTVTVSASLLCS